MEQFFQQDHYTSFINGKFIPSDGSAKPHVSPVTNKAWTKIQLIENVDAAIDAAV